MTPPQMLAHLDSTSLMKRAYDLKITIPAFNIPYLPMMKPVIDAVRDEESFAFVAVARLEWTKFESGSLETVREEYEKYLSPEYTRLHLDHIPVIDEDNLEVDYLSIIRRALEVGYDSVMIDGSRLVLRENIRATRAVCEIAHGAGKPVEAELGSVFGHEDGPPPSYAEIFRSKRGFTDPAEAKLFVAESACDWLSVAFGSVHGPVSRALRDTKKETARLDLDRLRRLAAATGVPLVLHGGSGIKPDDVRASIESGIAKVNVGTEIRQVYEQALRSTGNVETARRSVYERTRTIVREDLRVSESRARLLRL